MANKNIKGITIEIDGSTTGLDKALEGVNKKSREIQSELKEVDRLLKFNPKNTELVAQKQKLLSDAIENTKDKLEKLKSAQDEVNRQFEAGEIGEEQYRAVQREIVETESKLKNLEQKLKDTNTQWKDTAKAFDNFGKKSEAAGKKLLPVSAAIVTAGAGAAYMAMDFEDAMAKVSTIADETKVPIKELEAQILELSNGTGISASEIADNVYNAISAGQQTGDAVNFVANATKLSKAGFTDSGAALDVLTTIMNAYGLEAEEVNKVSDTLITTQNLGKTTVGELASSMGKLIPTAKANSVSLDQVGAGYALMTSNGVATAESTTYMNSMMNELGKSGTKTAKVLKEETGKTFGELMAEGNSLADVLAIVDQSAKDQGLAFSDMFGSAEAGKAGLILLGDGAAGFNDTLAQMQDSTGATDIAFDKLQTSSETIKIAFNQLKNTAIEFGGAIMEIVGPMISRLADAIGQFTGWFSGLSTGQKELIIKILAVVAVIGPLLIIIGKISMGISALMGIIPLLGAAFTFLASPIGIVIAVIAALVLAGVWLWKNWDKIKVFAANLGASLKTTFTNIKTAIVTAFTGVITGIKTIWTNIVAFMKGLPAQMLGFGKDMIQGLINGIKGMVGKVGTAVANVGKKIVGGIKGFFGINSPSKLMMGLGEFTGEGFAIGIENMAKTAGEAAQQLSGAVVNSTTTQTVNGGVDVGGTLNINITGEGAGRLNSDPRFIDQVKTAILSEITLGNRSIPNRTSLIPIG